VTDLGTLGGNFSAGTAINLSGEVAGWADASTGNQNGASLWNGDKITGLGVPSPEPRSPAMARRLFRRRSPLQVIFLGEPPSFSL
jgi:uncharacterized membrane protein